LLTTRPVGPRQGGNVSAPIGTFERVVITGGASTTQFVTQQAVCPNQPQPDPNVVSLRIVGGSNNWVQFTNTLSETMTLVISNLNEAHLGDCLYLSLLMDPTQRPQIVFNPNPVNGVPNPFSYSHCGSFGDSDSPRNTDSAGFARYLYQFVFDGTAYCNTLDDC